MITSRTLDFNTNKVEYLTLQELKSTIDENNTSSKPFNGITHYALWDQLCELADKRNVKFEIDKIAVTDSKNRMFPGVSIFPKEEEIYGRNALEAHLLRRVIGKISFPEYSDSEHGSGIAINFHQGGVELAYGNNVHVCSNLNIYGETHIATFGKNSIPLLKMFDVYEDWLYKLSDFRENDIKVINMMKDMYVEKGIATDNLIGKLMQEAVKTAYLDSTIVSPLNIGQVSTFTKNLLKSGIMASGGHISVWELDNIATEIIKPGTMNSQDLLLQSAAIGKFFKNEYLPQRQIEQLVY